MTYPNPTNLTGLKDLGTYANTVTLGWFWNIILFSLFCTIFFALKSYTAYRAFATASFITWLISLLLFVIGWIDLSIFILCSVLGGVGLVALKSQNQ